MHVTHTRLGTSLILDDFFSFDSNIFLCLDECMHLCHLDFISKSRRDSYIEKDGLHIGDLELLVQHLHPALTYLDIINVPMFCYSYYRDRDGA